MTKYRAVVTNGDHRLFGTVDCLTNKLGHAVHQTSAWYQAYIDNFGDVFSPYILQIVAEAGMCPIVGVLPLELYLYRGTRFWSLRRLRPLAFTPSDFVNLLFVPGQETAVAQAIAQWLWTNRQKWDEFHLTNIPESSAGWRPLYEALVEQGFPAVLATNSKFYKVDTTKNWDDYFDSYLSQENKDLLKDIRRLERRGVNLRVTTIQTNIKEYLPQIMPIYAQRRESLEQTNRYHTANRMAFFIRVIEAYEKFGGVELHLLQDDQMNTWAFQLDWLRGGIRYHYMHAYNEEYEKYSPGKLLLYKLLQRSFSDVTIRECNYMLGESDYKRRFTDSYEAYVSISITNKSSMRLKLTQAASRLVQLRNKYL